MRRISYLISYFIAGLALLTACLLVAGPTTQPASAQGFDDVTIEATQLTDQIYMLTGAGGNMGLCVGEDGVFLIDDQFAPLSEKILAAIAAITDQPVEFLFNTHWHGDHTGGNENFGEHGSLIFAHDNVRTRLVTGVNIELLGREVPPAPAGALPVVTYSENITFHYNGETIAAFHVAPAHTDGDGVVHFQSANVIHCGDVLFNKMYPFIDVSSGGKVDGVIAAAEQILALCDNETQLIPGHGELATKDDLAAYITMLRGARGAVAAEMADGKTLAAVIAAKPTTAWDDQWGQGFVNPDLLVESIYKSLDR